MSILRPRSWLYVALVGLGGLLLLAQAGRGPRPGPCFGNVQELKAWAEGCGLYYRSDWEDGRITDGLFVSTHPLEWERVGCLCRGAPGQSARWEGIIWATAPPGDWDTTPLSPWGADCHVWGGILVTGDRRLLDRIEAEGK
jgi:hypothetical protein